MLVTGLLFAHESKSSIGTTAVQLTTSKDRLKRGMLIKAAAGNGGIVYVGSSSAVTAGDTDATDGFELSAGDSVLVEVNNPSIVFAIADGADQKIFWIGT